MLIPFPYYLNYLNCLNTVSPAKAAATFLEEINWCSMREDLLHLCEKQNCVTGWMQSQEAHLDQLVLFPKKRRTHRVAALCCVAGILDAPAEKEQGTFLLNCLNFEEAACV